MVKEWKERLGQTTQVKEKDLIESKRQQHTNKKGDYKVKVYDVVN